MHFFFYIHIFVSFLKSWFMLKLWRHTHKFICMRYFFIFRFMIFFKLIFLMLVSIMIPSWIIFFHFEKLPYVCTSATFWLMKEFYDNLSSFTALVCPPVDTIRHFHSWLWWSKRDNVYLPSKRNCIYLPTLNI